ncbi:MAG: peptidoglycan DD-metalloendopeptidase family protein [Hyphomonadaceae bacterium]|nr:peptidoglycan DD-metalloendopeptidase family protein [Hyphomonadaceae bacterium]
MKKTFLPPLSGIATLAVSVRRVDAAHFEQRARSYATGAATLLGVLGWVAAAGTAPAMTAPPDIAGSALEVVPAPPPIAPWSVDTDGDGHADLANPTGHSVRGPDVYGSGAYAASRSGGKRRHRGVDYVSEPGEVVRAPITGSVTHVGYAYRGDLRFLFVEVKDAHDGLTARVLYVGPQVVEGQQVSAGDPIGFSQDLSVRYPNGITNHVHVEIADANGARLDASDLLPEGFAVHATNG